MVQATTPFPLEYYMTDFAQIIDTERAKLTTRKQELQTELTKIDTELKAMEAYLAAKAGKPAQKAGTRRSGIRNDVLTAISASDDGMNRADVLEHFNAKGDKKLEQSLSNALASLKKTGQISQSLQGTYYSGEQPNE